MSSVECLREFVSERLTAAAEEIFGVFKQTIVEYEEEIDRQRRLLDMVLKPEINVHRIELPQQHVCKEEEVLTDQQLWIQGGNCSRDQEDPEPPQIKEEQEELSQLVLKQETETFMLTPTHEESRYSEDQTLKIVISSMVSEPEGDHQLLSHSSHVAESQDQKGGERGDSGSTRDAEQEPQKKTHKSRSKSGYNSTVSDIHSSTHTGKNSFTCDTCGKDFKRKAHLQRHLRTHTGEKPYTCKTCGKALRTHSELTVHKRRAHTGEKPYACNTCEKKFCGKSELNVHVRIHTGEKPYICKTCGKVFRLNGDLTIHMRRAHTGEKPYACNTCGKRFCGKSELNVHIRIHTGEKPYTCKTCGKAYRNCNNLTLHIRRAHTGDVL